jgi:hypothetical protein
MVQAIAPGKVLIAEYFLLEVDPFHSQKFNGEPDLKNELSIV